MPSENSSIYRFGVFELDPRAGELRKSGVKLKLQDQPYQVLLNLLEHPGEIVSREVLRSALWHGDTFVDFETGLNTAISRLRETLGDSADNPTFIETLPRRGYKFIAQVERSRNGESKFASLVGKQESGFRKNLLNRTFLFVALVVLVLLALNVGGWRDRIIRPRAAPIRSLAVLPLQNLSGGPEQEYFADGMTEALITELGKFSSLRVISRQSTMHYKSTKKSAQQIAQELNVDAIVEGSVLRDGNRVRITAQLIAVKPERHLWSNSYDRELSDVLALDNEMARAVAKQIRITLTPQDEVRLATSRAVNPTAQEAYLQGRYFLDRRTKEDVNKALADFQKTIELASAFAPAYASLSEVYLSLAMYNPTQETELMAKAQAASRKALELDDGLSAAHYTLAAGRAHAWDWSGAEAEYRRAIELNPSNALAHLWYADVLIILGRLTEAEAETQRAEELDPASLEIHYAATAHLYYARRYNELIIRCQDWVKLSLNLEWNYHHCLGAAYVQIGKHDEAITELREALKSSTMYEHTATELANALAVAGKREEAWEVLGQVKNVPWKSFGDALVHTGLGENDAAFRSLERAIDLRAPLVTLLKVDPRFDTLRQDPRFSDLLSRMNFPK